MSRAPVPPPIIIPNCIQVRIGWQSGTVSNIRRFSNVVHGNLTAAGPINPALAETLFTAFKSALGSSAWGAQISTNVSMINVFIKDMRAGNNPSYESTSAAQAGSGTGIEIGLQTALVVTEQTAQSGRAFRGRVYLGGLVDGALASPTTSSQAAETAAVAFVNAIQAAMTTNQIPLVIAQKALGAGTDKQGRPLAPRVAAVVPVTNIKIVNSRLDTQRRRLGR